MRGWGLAACRLRPTQGLRSGLLARSLRLQLSFSSAFSPLGVGRVYATVLVFQLNRAASRIQANYHTRLTLSQNRGLRRRKPTFASLRPSREGWAPSSI